MTDSTSRIGGQASGATAGYTSVAQTAEGGAARGAGTARSGSATPNAGRGRVERVFTLPQSPDQLDRSAPRGSYLNILA
jgi:hypothetical protein